jgi:predicted ATPase/class 3 adenylate cyclase
MMASVRRDLPSGTVTFLFTDVEGSTKLLHELGPEDYADALAEHRRVIRESCAGHGGVEVDTQGDAFFVAFPTAPGALSAAAEVTEALASRPIQVRMGLHTGTPLLTAEGYVGGDVHRAARIAACGHGGQVLVSASAAQLVELHLTDLGEHRLKDLSAPERIYQLGEGDFPALKTLYRTNLPVPATPFLGRESELAEVLSLLAREDTRLLTLTGPGGTGKTRLALQAAAEAAEAFPDGIWWVPLAPLRDPTLVLETAAQAVGSKNGLAEHISDKAMLCLFDNFEQVVEAGAGLAELLSACPNLDLLVTSRERLRVSGEQTYPVPPLAEPDGVALFAARARAVDPSFTPSEAVGELCVRLDSLPLALELAAARTALFSPQQLLERLSQRLDLLKGERDADPRQQTLRATIEWSYDLLSEAEQTLFARLSVFAGGCTYDAAEEIAGADPDTLQSLLDKSLLRKRESELGPRYWMLETIREYAVERLEESGDADELRRRHAKHFLAFAEETEPYLRGRGSGEWLKRVDAEHDNLRAAMDEFEAVGESQVLLRLAGALSRFWNFKGHLVEAGRRLEAALLADERPTAARAKALNGAALIASNRGDVSTARLWGDEALTLHRQLGDALGAARSTYMLGGAAMAVPDWATARQLFDESLRAFVELEDEQGILSVTDTLALACYKLGDSERAWALAEDNLRRARAAGDEQWEATGLGALGFYAVADGRVQEALPLLAESTRKWRDWGELYWGEVGLSLCGFARAAAIADNAEVAVQLLSATTSLNEQIGAGEEPFVKDLNEETLVIIRSQLDEAAFAEAWEAGRCLTFDEAVALALDDIE